MTLLQALINFISIGLIALLFAVTDKLYEKDDHLQYQTKEINQSVGELAFVVSDQGEAIQLLQEKINGKHKKV